MTREQRHISDYLPEASCKRKHGAFSILTKLKKKSSFGKKLLNYLFLLRKALYLGLPLYNLQIKKWGAVENGIFSISKYFGVEI